MRILWCGRLAVASHRTLVDGPQLAANAVVSQRLKSIVGPKVFLTHRPLPQLRLSLVFSHTIPVLTGNIILADKIFLQPEALLTCHYNRRIRHLGNCLVVESGSLCPTLTAHIFSLQQLARLPAYIQTHIEIQRRI